MSSRKSAACIFHTLLFSAAYNQEPFILQTIYVLNKEILQKNPQFIIERGFKSRAGYNGERTVAHFTDYFLTVNNIWLHLIPRFFFNDLTKYFDQ